MGALEEMKKAQGKKDNTKPVFSSAGKGAPHASFCAVYRSFTEHSNPLQAREARRLSRLLQLELRRKSYLQFRHRKKL